MTTLYVYINDNIYIHIITFIVCINRQREASRRHVGSGGRRGGAAAAAGGEISVIISYIYRMFYVQHLILCTKIHCMHQNYMH